MYQRLISRVLYVVGISRGEINRNYDFSLTRAEWNLEVEPLRAGFAFARMKDRQIIITGFMGSGKSAVAQALARILECVALDLDYEITQREQRSPKEIIDTDSEPAFREIETRTLREILEKILKTDSTYVIALGGGTWTLERNRDLIRKNRCLSVWLDAPFDLCWKRILASGDERPLARDESEARNLYDERRASYQRADSHVAASENKSAVELAEEITQALTLGSAQ